MTVLDSVTRQPLAHLAQGFVREGTYIDSLQAAGESTMIATGEREGAYTIQVEALQYHTWRQTGVKVTGDRCHVHPRKITVLLQPED